MTRGSMSERSGSVPVHVDRDLKEIVPAFLEHQRGYIPTILTALDSGDYGAIRGLAHDMKGAGGGYGFDTITATGQAIERAALARNPQAITTLVGELSTFLEHVQVIYV